MVDLRVGEEAWTIGSGDFFFAFFSTVTVRLEPDGWGSRFPVVMHRLYAGSVGADDAAAAVDELGRIRAELAAFPPTAVVWDTEDLAKQPPWGDRISPDITDLGNYFVTADGEDLIDVLVEALRTGASTRQPLEVG